MNKKFIIVISSVLIILVVVILILSFNVNKNNDSMKFSKEYKGVSEDNVFVYKSINQIIKILEDGTGIVYLGFPECKWCQRYVIYLNDVAKNMGVKKIYYSNIYEDRKNNTKEYKKIVTLLSKYLDNDEEGNKRVYVPDVTFVNKGKIIGHDNETSQVTIEDGTVEEYWSDKNVSFLKTRLSGLINEVNENACSECN